MIYNIYNKLERKYYMAFVPIPKDLSKVKTKVVFGMTTRQLGFGSLALLVGVPTYLFVYKFTQNSTLAFFALMIVASPFAFFALFEKDGLTGEQFLKQYIQVRFKRNPKRVYRNENAYRFIQRVNQREDYYDGTIAQIKRKKNKKKKSKGDK